MEVASKEFSEAVALARTSGCAMEAAEEKTIGLSHCDTGKLLAEKWRLAPCIMDAIKYHHRFSLLSDYLSVVALTNLSDRLCRMHGLGYGFRESLQIDWAKDEAIEIICQAWPIARSVNWQNLSSDLDSYLKDVQKLVSVLYRFQQ
jgi:hypothetical protein